MKKYSVLILILCVTCLISCSETNNIKHEINESTEVPVEGGTGEVDAYMHAIKKIYNDDSALNSGISYIAIEVATLKGVSGTDLSILSSFAESKFKDFKNAGMDELKSQGEFDEETMSLKNGVLIRVDEIFDRNNNRLVFSMSKFRSGLGAIGMTFEYEKTDNGWVLKKITNPWIS